MMVNNFLIVFWLRKVYLDRNEFIDINIKSKVKIGSAENLSCSIFIIDPKTLLILRTSFSLIRF